MLPSDLMHIVLCYCEDADTPRAVTVAMLLRYKEFGQLLELSTVPSHYTDPSKYFRDSLVTDLLRKCKGLTDSGTLSAKAVESFYVSEAVCYRANERLTPLLYGACPEGLSERALEIFSLARKYVSFVLGACPDLPPGKFGPGATFADRGKLTTVPDKMSSVPTLTVAACGVISEWSKTAWGRAVSAASGKIDLVRGNRFTTVPKDSTKDRGIAVEPSINVFYQLAYGSEIRRRLGRVHVTLDHRQDVHRARARQASLINDLATIDLSSASDTMCSNLVKLLLPPSWVEALFALRSPFTLIQGKWVKLEKFSSMGNGFTFELETLVFQALCHAVMTVQGFIPDERRNLFVFGDDILVPEAVASDVIAVLSFCGFSVNRRKTFIGGSFKESCGGDFFLGRPVRAYFLKEIPSEPHQWMAFANGIRRVVSDHEGVKDLDFSSRAWRAILRCIPSQIRVLYGPDSLGDQVIQTSSCRWLPQSRGGDNQRLRPIGHFDPRTGNGIRYFKVWGPVRFRRVSWNHFQPAVVLATAVYGTGDGVLGVTPRDSVAGYHYRWVSA